MATPSRLSRLSCLFTAVAATGLLISCGGGGDDATPAPAPAPGTAPAPAPSVTAGAAAECFNSALFNTGTTYALNYQVSGALTGTSATNGSIGSATTFNGSDGVLPITQTVVTTYTAPAAISATGSGANYQRLEGMDVISHGSVLNISTSGFSAETRIVFNPPLRDKRYTLSTGGTYQITGNGTTTVTPPGTSQSSTTSSTVTYNGQESVTVPAGTYVACKFTEVVSGTGTTTSWIIKGKGVAAKTTMPSTAGDVTLQLQGTSRLNGAAI